MVILVEGEEIGDERLGVGRGHDLVPGGRGELGRELEGVNRGLAADLLRGEEEAVGGHAGVRVHGLRVVEVGVELGGVGVALADVAEVGAVAAVAEEGLALPDVVARISAAGDFLAVGVAARAPAADDVGAGALRADLLGVAIDAAVGGVDLLTTDGRRPEASKGEMSVSSSPFWMGGRWPY